MYWGYPVDSTQCVASKSVSGVFYSRDYVTSGGTTFKDAGGQSNDSGRVEGTKHAQATPLPTPVPIERIQSSLSLDGTRRRVTRREGSGVGVWPCVSCGGLPLLPGLALFRGWPPSWLATGAWAMLRLEPEEMGAHSL